MEEAVRVKVSHSLGRIMGDFNANVPRYLLVAKNQLFQATTLDILCGINGERKREMIKSKLTKEKVKWAKQRDTGLFSLSLDPMKKDSAVVFLACRVAMVVDYVSAEDSEINRHRERTNWKRIFRQERIEQ